MRSFTAITWRRAVAVLGLSLFVACGDDAGNGNPMTPTPIPSGSGPGPNGATITVGSNATVSPNSVTINVGESVLFVNTSNSRSHEFASDPHPAHTNCPSMNALGVLGPIQLKATNSFTGTGTCRFHDHNDPDNSGLKGTITIR